MMILTGTWEGIFGTTAAREPVLNGSVVAEKLVKIKFSLGGETVIVLDCQDRVVRSAQDRTLHFYFRIRQVLSNETGLPVMLERIGRFPGEVSRYTDTDLDWRQDGLGSLAPVEAGYLQADTSWRFGIDSEIPMDGTCFVYSRTRAERHSYGARIEVVLRMESGVLDSNHSTGLVFGPAG